MKRLLLAFCFVVLGANAAYANDDGHDHGGHDHGGHDSGFTIEEVADATKLAVSTLAESDPGLADAVFAFQGLISEEGAKVRLYVEGEEETIQINYVCHKHGDMKECHRQGF